MPDVPDPLSLERWLEDHGGDEPPASGLIRALAPVIRVRALKVLLRFDRGTEGGRVGRQVDRLAQDVWARLRRQSWQALRKWTPACGLGLFAWVGLVAECEVIERLHSRQSPVEGPLNHDEEEEHAACSPAGARPELELAPRELLIRVVHALRAELNPRGAAIFELLIIQEHPVEHVCTVMGMTQDAVLQWRGRIARRARDMAGRLLEAADRPPVT
jgi:hypothetical protein